MARSTWPLVPPWSKLLSSLAWITAIASKLVFLLPLLAPSSHYTWKSLITSLLCSKPSDGFSSRVKAAIVTVAYKVLHSVIHHNLSDLSLYHLLAHSLQQPPWLFVALRSCLVCSCLKAYAMQHGYGGIHRAHPHITQVFTQTSPFREGLPILCKSPNSLSALFFMALSILKITYLNYLFSIT